MKSVGNWSINCGVSSFVILVSCFVVEYDILWWLCHFRCILVFDFNKETKSGRLCSAWNSFEFPDSAFMWNVIIPLIWTRSSSVFSNYPVSTYCNDGFAWNLCSNLVVMFVFSDSCFSYIVNVMRSSGEQSLSVENRRMLQLIRLLCGEVRFDCETKSRLMSLCYFLRLLNLDKLNIYL